jgi:DNA polymerase V
VSAVSRLFALVDCSNFYCSCERLFRPDLGGVPVAVLSNNDGCVVARSEEVKALGIKMGAPFFKVREQLEAAGVVVFSSNYELYADLSRRVMDTLATFTPDLEVYSIDEAFLSLSAPVPADPEDLDRLALSIRCRVMRWTGIPVRVSLAPTKTLAKIGSAYAKRMQQRGREPAISLYGRTQCELDAVLASVPVGDVWGIGRAYGRKLPRVGITTALGLARANDTWIRRTMRVTGLRTALELRGVSCIPLEKVPPTRKSLVRSRSFSRPVTDVREMKEAVATHAARACEKLRAEGLAARAVQVFFHTGHEGARGPHRSVAQAVDLPRATNVTPEVLRVTGRLVEALWQADDGGPHGTGRPYPYRKAGVMLLDLTRAKPEQGHLFLPETPAADALMDALDAVNRRFGKRTVTLAAEGTGGAGGRHDTETGQDWAMRRQHKSPAYTTRWTDLPIFHAG